MKGHFAIQTTHELKEQFLLGIDDGTRAAIYSYSVDYKAHGKPPVYIGLVYHAPYVAGKNYFANGGVYKDLIARGSFSDALDALYVNAKKHRLIDE